MDNDYVDNHGFDDDEGMIDPVEDGFDDEHSWLVSTNKNTCKLPKVILTLEGIVLAQFLNVLLLVFNVKF